MPVLHPKKSPDGQFTDPDSRPAVIANSTLRKITQEFPTVWKGADIYSFGNLPYYYRVTALAVARAGIVVSPIATAVQEVFHVEQPDLNAINVPTVASTDLVTVTTEGTTTTVLQIKFPLLSHYDLMDAEARKVWVDSLQLPDIPDPNLNVAWWPDPDVVYSVARQLDRNGAAPLREEDAEIRLVASGDATPTAQPIVVRARGTRFSDAVDLYKPDDRSNPANPLVTRDPGRARPFVLRASLKLRTDNRPLATGRVVASGGEISESDCVAFNKQAGRYAVLAVATELKVDIKPPPATVAAALDRAKALATKLGAVADDKSLTDLLGLGAATMLTAESKRLSDLHDHPPATLEAIIDAAKQPNPPFLWPPWQDRSDPDHPVDVAPLVKFPLDTSAGEAEGCVIAPASIQSPLLVLRAIPSSAEFEDLQTYVDAQGEPFKTHIQPVIARMRAMVRELITGGAPALRIRAVHGRGGVSTDLLIPFPDWLETGDA